MRKLVKRMLVMLLAFSFVFSGTMNMVNAAKVETVKFTVEFRQSEVREMLSMINEFRTGKDAWYWNSDDKTKTVCSGLEEFVYDYELEQIAMQRAAELALSFSHARPDGSRCFTAYTDSYNYGSKAENVAVGFSSVKDVFVALCEEDENYAGQGHRRNMLASGYRAVGLGHVYYNGVHFWAQEFSSVIGNDEETEAMDEEGEVTTKVDTSKIVEASASADTSAVSVQLGKKIALPTVSGKVRLDTGWGGSCRVTVACKWKVADTSIAKISSGKIVPKKVGVTKLTTTALGKKITVKLTVKPKTTSIVSLKAKREGFKVTWKKQTKQVSGYQLQYATNKSFKNATKITVKKNSTVSKTVKSLSSNKTYYVRVRTYKTVKVNGKSKNIYSSWSKSKTIKTN